MVSRESRWRQRMAVVAALSATVLAPERAGRADAPTPSAAATSAAAPRRPTAPPLPEGPFPFLPGERPHSVSLGDTSDGRLVGAVRLAQSPSLGILPHQRQRPYRWGTGEIVAVLEQAGRELWRQTGTRLWVGHLSKREGGDIPYSVSHNNGRDADIAFCYRDASGKPVDPDDLVPVLGNGHTTQRGLHFDVARTWLVVKALITQRRAQVQFLFMSRPIEGMLLMHAKARGEPKAVRRRAARVIHQPGHNAALHNDHLHLRLYCSRADVLAGCRNEGLVHPFTELHRRDEARFATGLRRHLQSDVPEVRRRAIERIGLLDAKLLGAEVAAALSDASPAVRRAAAMTLARFGEASHRRLVKRYRAGLSPSERIALGREVAPRREPEAGRLLAALLDDAGSDAATLVALCGRSTHLACVPALVRRLADADRGLRNRAAEALGRLTGHRYAADYAALSGRALDLAQQKWRNAWAAGRQMDRRAWLMRGLHEAGFEPGRLEPEDAWSLVRALSGPAHLARNAEAELASLFDQRGDCTFWRSWLGARRAAFDLPPPPRQICAGGGARATAR